MNTEDDEFTRIAREQALNKMADNARELGLDYEPAQQEPVAMRMPKVGDEVVCIEDESLGTVAYLTAGGSPEIRFDDGSHGTYMLREFAELFRYTSPSQRAWVGLTEEKIKEIWLKGKDHGDDWSDVLALARSFEAELKDLNK